MITKLQKKISQPLLQIEFARNPNLLPLRKVPKVAKDLKNVLKKIKLKIYLKLWRILSK